VSFVTSPGYGDGTPGWRKKNGLLGAGPAAIVTTLCVFRFPEGGGEAYLDSIHPDHSLEEVRENTGWSVHAPEDAKETPAPSASELEVMRKVQA
jgi:glutaconate CoA-transferase subunit B